MMDNVHKLFLQNLDGFVEVVTVMFNDDDRAKNIKKMHALMRTKLKESARAARGLFPNQLMRVSHLHEAGGMSASALVWPSKWCKLKK